MAISALHPIDPSTVATAELEQKSPWIVRKLAGSMTGRIVVSAYETLRASANVVCLSPWGDSSPLLLPNIRFRDLLVHAIIVGTGGTAVVAAPVLGPVAHSVVAVVGDSIIVQLGVQAGFDVTTKLANDLVIGKAVKSVIPPHSSVLVTSGVKVLRMAHFSLHKLITLKYKHLMTDAALGFFRASNHEDPKLFSSVKEFMSIEKGWMAPFLFATHRRPVIPRIIQPDVVFCHGPFVPGDYRVAQTLLEHSALVIELCATPEPDPAFLEEEKSGFADLFHKLKFDSKSDVKAVETPASDPPQQPPPSDTLKNDDEKKLKRSSGSYADQLSAYASQASRSVSDLFHRPKTPTTPAAADETSKDTTDPAVDSEIPPVVAAEPKLRRMIIVVLGIRPHRAGLWTSSERPGESVMNYALFNGCPAVVLPLLPGSPLVAWHAYTLEQFQKLEGGLTGPRYARIVERLFQYIELCIDWERVVPDAQLAPGSDSEKTLDEQRKMAVRRAVEALVTGAVQSDCKEVRKEVDSDRAGIAFFRVP